ncbi:MAG TPA: hypothetical protein PLS70_05455, partial [Acidobacteriota bacterium]|nr:hypothetical protein [Acidobacteriota bacterium]
MKKVKFVSMLVMCLVLMTGSTFAQKSKTRTSKNGSTTTATAGNGTAARESQVNGAYGNVQTSKSASNGSASKTRTATGVRGTASKDTDYDKNG